ncbi:MULTISPECIES: carbohydrate ABC transporter permease [Streptomyces violaceusniger group]|uniref:Carbohydrate ABC transporter permease n=2 Tax=Streptomyces javensis TaxID=114698 RepID=A0ABN1XEM9_9ACTN|nr:carbohydrate ABC transporter permease [Streptomyces javensis]MBI0318833.1 carbohydrate ABC transporter permease [Streptomyces javensis]
MTLTLDTERSAPHSGTSSSRAPRSTPARLRPALTRLLAYCVFAALAVAVLYPLCWMALSGLKTNGEIFSSPWSLPGEPRWGTYADAWDQGVLRYLLNSALVTSASVLAVVLISAWAAYGLTRLDIPCSQPALLLVLGAMMLSPTVALVPLSQLLQALGIYDTYWALIVLYTAFKVPFTTFLIRAYLLGLPTEVEEAAHIDGAGRWQIFWRVVVPMARPILVSAAVLQALFAWNEYAFALVFITDDHLKTLPVGLADMAGRLNSDWPMLFAGLTIAALPMIVVFLLGQRHFVRGLAEGVGK